MMTVVEGGFSEKGLYRLERVADVHGISSRINKKLDFLKNKL